LNSIGDGVIVTNSNGIILMMNKVAENLTGYNSSEAEGVDIEEIFPIVHSTTGEKVENPVKKAIENREVIYLNNNTTLISRNGDEYNISDSAAPIFNEKNILEGVVLIFSDVTNQYKLRKKLKAQYDFLDVVINSITHPFSVINVEDYTISLANKAYQEKYIEGKCCYEIIHGGEKKCQGDRHPCPIERIKETGESVTLEHIHQDKNGEDIFVEIHAEPIYNENGQLVQILEYSFDITSRKKAELQLKESKSRLQAITNAIMDAIIMIDNKGKINFWNPAAERIFGYKQEETLGKDLHKLIVPEHYYDEFKNAFPHFQQTGKGGAIGKTQELTAIKKNGMEITVELSLSAIKVQETFHAVGIIRDISSRKLSETRLQEYTMEIELKNIELDYVYQRLEESFKKAKSIHERLLPENIIQQENLFISAHYEPEEKMGGDLYNVVDMGKKTFFYLLDVTGHGLDSAILSLFVKNTIDDYINLAAVEDISPNKVMEYLTNRYFQERFPEDYFVSLFCGIIDLDKMELTYSNAGLHIPPIITNSQGISRLESADLIISTALPRYLLEFSNHSIRLDDGMTLFFTTDGLTEQISKTGEMYADRLIEIIKDNYYLPPEGIRCIVNSDLNKFVDYNNKLDDITFLIMQIIKKKSENIIKIDIPSIKEKVDDYIYKLLAYFDKSEESRLHIVLTELLANALEHGNKYDAAKTIKVSIEINKKYYKISIEDEGEGFDWFSKKKNIKKTIVSLDSNFVDRGRGMAIVEMSTDCFYYNNRGNKATFINKSK
ncbi:MAG: PAS domain S-box protein, partial [bacterium]